MEPPPRWHSCAPRTNRPPQHIDLDTPSRLPISRPGKRNGLGQAGNNAATGESIKRKLLRGHQRMEWSLGKQGVTIAEGGRCVIEVIEIVAAKAAFLVPAERRVEASLDVERPQSAARL